MAKCGVCGKPVKSGKVLCMPCACSIMTCGHPERVCRDCCLYVVKLGETPGHTSHCGVCPLLPVVASSFK